MPTIYLKGKYIGEINGILFDKDGTLINSEKRLLDLSRFRINEAKKKFKKENYPNEIISTLEDLLSKAYGIDSQGINPNGSIAIASKQDNLISTATIFSLITQNWPKSLEIANEIFSKSKASDSGGNYKSKGMNLLPGVISMLNKAKDFNIKLGIISNDTKIGIKKFLKENRLEDKFHYLWSSDDIPSKPNPNAVKYMCKSMKLNISKCALIGDSNSDMRMARKSGIKLALGYISGWKREPLLYEHHHLIYHWNDLNFQD